MKKIEEINNIINSNNQELIYYTFFKLFLEYPDQSKEIIKYFKKDVKNINKIYNQAKEVLSLKKTSIKFMDLIQYCTNSEDYYKEILNKCKKLALELNLNNSLEVANLYTYLLWNGYFSENKNLIFQKKDRLNIPGFYSLDIMSGKGVCLNFSDMLSDFINEFEDYKSATLVSTINDDIKRNYKVELARKIKEKTLCEKLILKLYDPIIGKTGNHAYNLIKENNIIYIYDSTNLSAFNLANQEKSILINGNGISKINPYLSYAFNFNSKSIETLDSIHENLKINSGYNIRDFIVMWEECLCLFKKNRIMFEDFYNEIKKEIINISKNNSSVKLMLKEYKRNNI